MLNIYEQPLVPLHLEPRGALSAQDGDLLLAERKRNLGRLWVFSQGLGMLLEGSIEVERILGKF